MAGRTVRQAGLRGHARHGVHRRIHDIRARGCCGEHRTYAIARGVVRVHMDGHERKALPKRTNEKARCRWGEQASHVFHGQPMSTHVDQLLCVAQVIGQVVPCAWISHVARVANRSLGTWKQNKKIYNLRGKK